MKYIAICAAAAALAACSSTQSHTASQSNPASEFCVKKGGISEIRKKTDGSEYGVCRFRKGKVVDEWDFYRQHHK